MDAWRKEYQQQCPGAQDRLRRDRIGRRHPDFTDGKADFAGSDAALDPKAEMPPATKQCGSPAIDMPMVVGPVAIAYNLKRRGQADPQRLDGRADLPRQDQDLERPGDHGLNKGVNLPSTSITAFFRSDESGTTQNFESYLAAAAPKDFTSAPSKGTGAGTGQGQDRFAGRGRFGHQTAAASATSSGPTRSGAISIRQDRQRWRAGGAHSRHGGQGRGGGEGRRQGRRPEPEARLRDRRRRAHTRSCWSPTRSCAPSTRTGATGKNVKEFLNYTVGDGQKLLLGLGSAPLPDALATKVKASIAKIS